MLRFGLLRFRSPLLTESISLSFPPGTLMFQFPGLPPAGYVLTYGCPASAGRVPPFGNPGIQAHVQLPQAYRRLSRPSSLSGSKASAARLNNFRPSRDVLCFGSRFASILADKKYVDRQRRLSLPASISERTMAFGFQGTGHSCPRGRPLRTERDDNRSGTAACRPLVSFSNASQALLAGKASSFSIERR